MPDEVVNVRYCRTPAPGGWNRIHLIVEHIAADVDRLRAVGLTGARAAPTAGTRWMLQPIPEVTRVGPQIDE